jgi:hypothetical protein
MRVCVCVYACVCMCVRVSMCMCSVPCGMMDGPLSIKEAASRSSLRPDMYL